MFAAPFKCRDSVFDGARTYVMGVVNVTPDSFSDGGRFADADAAVAHGCALARQGADLVDVGGESTRPGAQPVDARTERARVLPVIERLRAQVNVPISIDTTKAEVADAALDAGADVVNDISGGHFDPEMRALCARHGVPMVIGHLRGRPQTMQEAIAFHDVFDEVRSELGESIARARAAGVRDIVVDPGIGFGKTVEHNLVLLARAGELAAHLGVPVMVGPSRKRFLGALAGGASPNERHDATLGAVVAAAMCGANFVRVHDVLPSVQALTVADAIRGARS